MAQTYKLGNYLLIKGLQILISICPGIQDGTNEECDISTIFEHIKHQEDGKLDILINNFYDYNYLNTCKHEKPISICDQPVVWENIIHQCHGLRKQLISISLASRYAKIIVCYSSILKK